MSGSPCVQCRVSPQVKTRLGELAAELGLSESALLKRSVTLMLKATSVPSEITKPARVPRDLRLYVRLRPEDHRLLAARADARGMPSATYASMLLRAHLQSVVPLPDREIGELKRAVGELGMIGRNLNQIAKVMHQTGKVTGPSVSDLHAILRALQGLRDHVKALMQANADSWESGRG